MKAFPEFRATDIHNQVQANVKLPQSKLVAIGRAFESGELMATVGTLLYKTTKLDCQKLMTSSCYITKAGIGGPLIGYGGNFVGMNFCSKDGTPFLPASLLSKCLKHFDRFGFLMDPQQQILESKLVMSLPRLMKSLCSVHKSSISWFKTTRRVVRNTVM